MGVDDCTCSEDLWNPACPVKIHRDSCAAKWEAIEWPPLGEKDCEFQALQEMNVANLSDIYKAFMLNPDDLPGLGFLDKKKG